MQHSKRALSLLLVYRGTKMNDNEVIEKYKRLVYKVCNKIYREAYNVIDTNMVDIEDLIQWGYVGLLNANRNYKESSGVAFITYATTCIKNKVRAECVRPRLVKTYLRLGNGSLDANTILNGKELPIRDVVGDEDDNINQIHIFDVFDRLPSRKRYIFQKHFIEGYQIKEIAKILGCSGPAVSHEIKNIKKRLQQEFKLC